MCRAADGYRQAREAAEKALALDPQLVDAHLAMGSIHQVYDWDWAGADASFRRALDLEPGNAQALRLASSPASTLGNWSEAIDLASKAVERDPLRPASYNNLGITLLAVNRDAAAEAAIRKALELDPGGASWHYGIGRALLLQGKDRCRPPGDAAGNGGGLAALWVAARISRARSAQASPTRRSQP
jgi:tetratricopeptide (TPR) repeat protein